MAQRIPLFSFLSLLSICILLVFACSTDKKDPPTIGDEQVDNNPFIEEKQEEIGLKDINPSLKIGAIVAPLLDNTDYLSIHSEEFNSGQSLWYAGFGSWPEEDTIDYTNLNNTINWMVDNQLSPHVHMIVGPNFYMPDWLKNGTWTNEELEVHLKNLIYGIMDVNENKEKVDAWNVINEVFNQDGTYRNTDEMLWVQLGMEDDTSGLSGEDQINDQHPVFIRKSFEYARDKTSKILEYRDYLIEATNPANGWDKKHKAVFQLLKHMQNSSIPIDAIGIQGHHDIGNMGWILDNNRLKNVVEKFHALNLEVYITELDIGSKDQEWTTELAEQQKTDYFEYIKQSIEGGASRIYTWGVYDGLDPTWRTNEHPLPWDENLEKKPAYYGIMEALNK